MFFSSSIARYKPYGGYLGTPPTATALDRGYTGHDRTAADDGLGLVYMNARYLDSSTGRFISADTLVPEPGNPQAFNRYSYALGNPLGYSDPSGHCALSVIVIHQNEETLGESPFDANCWREYHTLYELLSSWGYDPLEYLGGGTEWKYIGLELDELNLREAYENSDFQELGGGPFDRFYQGHVFWHLYSANEELAFEHFFLAELPAGVGPARTFAEEPDSALWARMYSEYFLRRVWYPISDEKFTHESNAAYARKDFAYVRELDAARAVGYIVGQRHTGYGGSNEWVALMIDLAAAAIEAARNAD